MIKLSVIIPVYNTEKYLEQCLESILTQDFHDIEIICVDDGSTDNSLQILQKYSEKIVVLKQANKGSGVARNLALSQAKGEYILFVDSDDKLMPNACSKLIGTALKTNAEVIVFGGLTYSKDKLRKGSYSFNKIPRKYHNKIFDKHIFKNDMFKFPPTAWTKLYKKDFLLKNNIKFQEIFVGQDQIFFVKAMLTASKIFVLPENLYFYRKKRPGSVTSAKKKTNSSPIDVFWAVNNVLQDEDYKYKILERYFLKATFWLPKMREDLKPNYYNDYIKILEFLKQEYPKAWWKGFSPKINTPYLVLKFQYVLCNLILWKGL